MVVSHAKLKRKRKEEAALLVEGGAVSETPSSSTRAATSDGAGEGKKKKKVKKNEKQKNEDDVAGNYVELAALKGAGDVAAKVEVLNDEAEATDKITLKKLKKEEKKRRKAIERETAASQNAQSVSTENGVHLVEIRTGEAAGNGVEAGEQLVGEKGATLADFERPLSVREKKGKKKKGAKDRWGVKIAEEVDKDENPGQTEVVREALSASGLASGEMHDPRKVVVGGMPYYVTEDDIHEYFTECGDISELDCMIFPDTGKFRGIAFITFKSEEAAAKALEYDGEDMGGRFLKIEKCKIKPGAAAKNLERGEVGKTSGSTSAYIGNLSWDVTEDLIKNFFKKTYTDSKVDSIRLAFDKESGDFKGFGHVEFGDDESLEAAVKMNQTPLLGRPMKVAYSVPPKQSSVHGVGGNSASRAAGTCYTCGEAGHKAFLCPKKGSNADDKFDSQKVSACYSCGEEGHKSFLCPKKKFT